MEGCPIVITFNEVEVAQIYKILHNKNEFFLAFKLFLIGLDPDYVLTQHS